MTVTCFVPLLTMVSAVDGQRPNREEKFYAHRTLQTETNFVSDRGKAATNETSLREFPTHATRIATLRCPLRTR